MSAAKWRKAMNTAGAGVAPLPATQTAPLRVVPAEPQAQGEAPRWMQALFRHVGPRHWLVAIALAVFPFATSPFLTFQVGAQSLILGMVALSLMFLSGYGGITSLAQMTVAGVAGYTLAILGTSSTAISLGWPWPVAIVFALAIATAVSVLIGWLSVRTEGIYTIMITLAMGVAFYYLALQNYTIFNGFQGFQKVHPPMLFGVDWRSPLPFYFLTLFFALAGYFAVKYIARAPFGIALQGIRDNPRRMNALGYNVTAHRVAAYAVAGFIAAVAGILLVWYNGLITPGSVGTSWLINILVIAVLGGMRHPIGPFLGALVFVLLQTFAVDVIDRERFNLVIGGVFLAIVLFSPDGLLGLWAGLRARLRRRATVTSPMR
ncbi:MAG TPA: branched-chain amino acid ABC transporter permease [Ramlibacter sp.]|nr:branched-chain amino acid ABC transporter permease [Ramlibacter sp.]